MLLVYAVYVPSTARHTLVVASLMTVPLLGCIFVAFSSWDPALHDPPAAIWPKGQVGDMAYPATLVQLRLVGDRRGHGGRLFADDLWSAQGGERHPAARTVHAREEARRRRDGRGLPRLARDASPAHRHQAPPARPGRKGRADSLRARGPTYRDAHASQHRDRLRLRAHDGRRLLLRHGAPGRCIARRDRRGRWSTAGGARHPPPRTGRGIARRGARRRAHSSRRQARQHPGRRSRRHLRPGEGRRLRPGEGRRLAARAAGRRPSPRSPWPTRSRGRRSTSPPRR